GLRAERGNRSLPNEQASDQYRHGSRSQCRNLSRSNTWCMHDVSPCVNGDEQTRCHLRSDVGSTDWSTNDVDIPPSTASPSPLGSARVESPCEIVAKVEHADSRVGCRRRPVDEELVDTPRWSRPGATILRAPSASGSRPLSVRVQIVCR